MKTFLKKSVINKSFGKTVGKVFVQSFNKSFGTSLRNSFGKLYFKRYSTLNLPNKLINKSINKSVDKSIGYDVLVAISKLERLGVKIDKVPTLAVFGDQSVGKSAVLSMLFGKDIFPQGSGIVTLKPTHLTIIRDNIDSFIIGDKTFTNSIDALNEVKRLNSNNMIEQINIRAHSTDKNVYNMTLIDNPGLCNNSEIDVELPEKIEQMNLKFIKNKHIIPLVIIAGNGDPANSQALRLIMRNKRSRDSIGIITKTDIAKDNDILIKLLSGKMFPLGHGYHAVCLRSKEQFEKGVSVDEHFKFEKDFFTENSELVPNGGIELRKLLSGIQLNMIRDKIPEIIENINEKIDKLENDKDFLDRLLNNENENLAIKLTTMIKELHQYSPYRALMEDKLRRELEAKILPLIINSINEDELPQPEFSKQLVDRSILKKLSKMKAEPVMYMKNRFRRLFSGGLISAVNINNENIRMAETYEQALDLTCSMVEFIVEDNNGIERMEWIEKLHNKFENILINDNVQDIVYQTTEHELLSYIARNVQKDDDLSIKFSEYIIKQIGQESYQSTIKQSIGQLLKTEERPNMDRREMIRNITQIYPEYFTFKGGIVEPYKFNNKKFQVKIFDEVYTWAYMNSIGDKLSRNISRLVGVNFLDILIQKLMEMIIEMFHKENALKEQEKVNDKISELRALKDQISKFF